MDNTKFKAALVADTYNDSASYEQSKAVYQGVRTALDAGITPVISASMGGATSTYTYISLATTNPVCVKASAGTIAGGQISNTSAASKWLKIFNLAVAPTVGTSSPVQNYEIKANSTLLLGDVFPDGGLRLPTGIAFAITNAQALLDTTVVAAGDVSVNLIYA